MTNVTPLGVKQIERRVHFDGDHVIVDRTTGETITASVSVITTGDSGFVKFWVANILAAVDDISNQKIKVLWYILSRVDRASNELHETVGQIAAGSGTSRRTVDRTFRSLVKHDIIRRRFGYVILNPNVMMRGSAGKRHALLIRFQQIELPLDYVAEKTAPRRLRAVS